MVELANFRAFDPAAGYENPVENERRFRAAVEGAFTSIDAALSLLDRRLSSIPQFLSYVKPSDETRVSSTAYTVDGHLVSESLAAGAVYRFEMTLLMSGDTAQDLRFRVERTGLSDADLRFASDLDNPVAPTLTWNSNVNNNLAGAAVLMGNYIGILRTGADTGTVRLAWGQQVSGAPAIVTTLRAGSMMALRRVA